MVAFEIQGSSTEDSMAEVNSEVLNALVGKMLGDLGGAFSVPTARIGYRLGLFKALAQEGPMTSENLAGATKCSPRYVQEWAMAQAANGYVTFDPATASFSLSPEQAMVFALEDSPVYLAGAFDLAAAMVDGQNKVEDAFRTGMGVTWGESAGCLFCAVGAFFRPGYVNAIVQSWLPALDGVVPALEQGGRVADIGCGVGFSTLLMAEAFPNSQFVGYDFHAPSIEQANAHATAHGLTDRVRFETVVAKEIQDRDFDLITMFDCLHDMGDPRGCASHIRSLLKPNGRWMLVEPIANDKPSDNIDNPVSRLFYNASTMICVPTSLSQEVGEALGAQAGEVRLTEVLMDAGFSTVRRAIDGPFNMVLEARP